MGHFKSDLRILITCITGWFTAPTSFLIYNGSRNLSLQINYTHISGVLICYTLRVLLTIHIAHLHANWMVGHITKYVQHGTDTVSVLNDFSMADVLLGSRSQAQFEVWGQTRSYNANCLAKILCCSSSNSKILTQKCSYGGILPNSSHFINLWLSKQ